MKHSFDEDFLKHLLLEEAEKKSPTPKEQAKDILKKLESNLEVFREFNLLLRQKKLKKIRNERKV